MFMLVTATYIFRKLKMDKASIVSLGTIFHYSLTFEVFNNFWIFWAVLV